MAYPRRSNAARAPAGRHSRQCIPVSFVVKKNPDSGATQDVQATAPVTHPRTVRAFVTSVTMAGEVDGDTPGMASVGAQVLPLFSVR